MTDEAKLTELNKKLENSQFLAGNAPGKEDAETFEEFKSYKTVPCCCKFPYVFSWYSLMVLFEDPIIESWKVEKEEKGKKQEQKGKKGKKEEKKEKEEKKDDDDDFDPFAEETEDDKKALEEMAKKKKEDGKKKGKKKEIDKSLILLEVKGYDADQDSSVTKNICILSYR